MSFKTYHGQSSDEGVNIGLLGGLHHFVHGGLPRVVTVPDVLGQGAVEQDGLLRDDAHAGSNPGNVEGLDVVIVDSLELSKSFKLNALLASCRCWTILHFYSSWKYCKIEMEPKKCFENFANVLWNFAATRLLYFAMGWG